MDAVDAGGLTVARVLYDFVTDEAIPGTGVDPARFWIELAALVREFGPRLRTLLGRRDALQRQIDQWHAAHPARPINAPAYRQFLTDVGYLVPEPPDFTIGTAKVDPEIATIAGPQLVVPVTNARYALNAANARWGSLYDALYGTDAIPEDGGATRGPGYNQARGEQVIARARAVLDEAAPLAAGSHADAAGYAVAEGRLSVRLRDGSTTGLAHPAQFAGFGASQRRPPPCCCATTGCTSKSSSTAPIGSAGTTRPASPTWCWKRPSPPSRTARIPSPRSTPATRWTPTATGSA